ncbi:MAG: AraC-like DNA-binding protein [Spirosomataceae bacterium]|jgi:AraC-like DNA-binding protein
MNAETLIAAVTLVTILISLLLAVFLLSVRTERKLSNQLFAAFLILTAIDIFGVIATPETIFFGKLDVFRSMMIFLHLPVFYLYILSVCYADFSLQKKDLLHGIPFVLVVAFLALDFLTIDHDSKQSIFDNQQQVVFFKLVFTSLHIQVFTYLFLCFKILLRTRKLYVENYSGEQFESYKWLFQLITALTIFYVLALVKNVAKFSEESTLSEWFRTVLLIFELLVLCGYLFKALSKPTLFRGINSGLQLVSGSQVNESDTLSTDLPKIEEYMQTEKPYLDPSVTIQQVADGVNIPVRELSLLINKQIGKHFFDFVNEYRIAEAKKILADVEQQKLTVLEILYSVGFNSKSSFNTAFKKHTGTTPTSYRKSLIINKL